MCIYIYIHIHSIHNNKMQSADMTHITMNTEIVMEGILVVSPICFYCHHKVAMSTALGWLVPRFCCDAKHLRVVFKPSQIPIVARTPTCCLPQSHGAIPPVIIPFKKGIFPNKNHPPSLRRTLSDFSPKKETPPTNVALGRVGRIPTSCC